MHDSEPVATGSPTDNITGTPATVLSYLGRGGFGLLSVSGKNSLETSIQLLVVDDEALILDFAVTALEDGGYVVVTADASLPALALLEGTTPPFLWSSNGREPR